MMVVQDVWFGLLQEGSVLVRLSVGRVCMCVCTCACADMWTYIYICVCVCVCISPNPYHRVIGNKLNVWL
jgi:hypothetical protein